jgi:glycosyltransferase involved in cell wall biosynthesis
MKKKLLVTASTFPRYEGDTEPRFVLDLCKELNKYYDVTVLVPAAIGAKDEEMLEGVHVVRYHYFPIHRWEILCYPGAIVPRIKEKKARILLVPFLFLALYFKLFQILPQYDVVHAHWLIPQGIVQGLFKKPYLVTGHGGDVTSLNKGILRKLKAKCIKKASYVTAVSQALLDVMNEIYPAGKSDIISMGCNTKNFGVKYKKENYFNQNKRKVILFVGRLAEKKGVTYLIEAMNHVDAKLVIVGSGPLENELKIQAKVINVTYPERIVFIGSKTHDELREIYASADIFCAPSITAKDGDKEGFGLVILEAMASGLPVVASYSGGIIDLITESKDGMFTEEKNSIDIANKLNQLIEDEDLYNNLCVNVRTTAERYDYEVIGKSYRDIIERII